MNGDKVVLVTGGARRIGAAIVGCLHREGYRIILHYNESEQAALSLASDLNAERPDSVRLLQGDLSQTASLDALIQCALMFWGRLDGLVNNASVFTSTPLGSVTVTQWNGMMAANLAAPFFLAQAAAVALRAAGGVIVNIVDVYAERPLPAFPVYSITKAGLAALTRSLAVELAPEIRVNGVSPGAILWPEMDANGAAQSALLARVPMNRCGEPQDIARAVLFLLRDAAYVTGQILAVDGGRNVFI